MRGLRLDLTGEQIARRALSMIGYVPLLPQGSPWAQSQALPIQYVLGNGGRDPTAPHPGQIRFGKRKWCCDCSGFASWAEGFDRYQPGHRVEWLSTDGMIRDAHGPNPLHEVIETPELGSLVVYPDYMRGGKKREGHVGVVTRVPAEWSADYVECWEHLGITHCSSSQQRIFGGAINETRPKAQRVKGEIGGELWSLRRGVFLRRV